MALRLELMLAHCIHLLGLLMGTDQLLLVSLLLLQPLLPLEQRLILVHLQSTHNRE
jgi:hypothetical protein